MALDVDAIAATAIDFTNCDLALVCRQMATRFANPIEVIAERARFTDPYGPRPGAARRPSDVMSPSDRLIFSYLKEVTRWQPANPNKDIQRQKLLDTYVGLTNGVDGSNHVVANFIEADGNFAIERAIRQSKYIVLTGLRGSGKTAFLNYWLSSRTKALELEGLTWFRIDASKVRDMAPLKPGISVEQLYLEYFRLHTLYVVLLYGGALSSLDDSQSAVGVDTYSDLFRDICATAKSADPKAHLLVVETFRRALAEAVEQSVADLSTHVVKIVFRAQTRSMRNSAARLFSSVCQSFAARRVSTIVVIDGIDNIAWTKRNRFYRDTCRNLGRILSALRVDLGEHMQVVLAARPETVTELRFQSKGVILDFNHTNGEPPFAEWKIVAPNVAEIVARKVAAATASPSFDRERSKCLVDLGEHSSSLLHTLGDLAEESTRYPRDIAESIRSSSELGRRSVRTGPTTGSPSLDDISEHTVVRLLFNDDIRAYVDNLTKVYFTRHRMVGLRSLGKRARQLRLLQYIFLNGRPFFDSRDHHTAVVGANDGIKSRANYQDRGAVFPNIFWWPLEETVAFPTRWHGLAGYRVLQIARHIGTSFVLGDLLHVVARLFGYHRSVLTEIAETFVATGLIDVSLESARQSYFERSGGSDMKFESYKSLGSLSRKGRLFMDYVWMRPDILYFYALDTPLHIELLTEDTRLVRPCREFASLNFIEDFFRAAIPTVATFLLHIKHFAATEHSRVQSVLERDQSLSDYLGDSTALLRNLELPNQVIDGFFRGFVKAGISRVGREEVAQEIGLDVEGVLGGVVARSRQAQQAKKVPL